MKKIVPRAPRGHADEMEHRFFLEHKKAVAESEARMARHTPMKKRSKAHQKARRDAEKEKAAWDKPQPELDADEIDYLSLSESHEGHFPSRQKKKKN